MKKINSSEEFINVSVVNSSNPEGGGLDDLLNSSTTKNNKILSSLKLAFTSKFFFFSSFSRAFSLIELLIALVSISCIMGAFAPVITKKLSTTKAVNGAAGGGAGGVVDGVKSHLYEFKQNQTDCSATKNANNQITCSLKIPENVRKIGLFLAGGGGGGGGAGVPCVDIGEFNDDSEDASSGLNIVPELKNVVIKTLIGAGGGGGGGSATVASWWSSSTRTAEVWAGQTNNVYIRSGANNIAITTLRGASLSGENCYWEGTPSWRLACIAGRNIIVEHRVDGVVTATNNFLPSSTSYDYSRNRIGNWCNFVAAWTSYVQNCSDWSETRVYNGQSWQRCSSGYGSWNSSCGMWEQSCHRTYNMASTIQNQLYNQGECTGYGGVGGGAGNFSGSQAIDKSLVTGGFIWLYAAENALVQSEIKAKKPDGSSIYYMLAHSGTAGSEAVCNTTSCANGSSGISNCTLNMNGTTSTNCSTAGAYAKITFWEPRFNNYNGGGGQSGAVLQNFVIPDDILKENIGGKIHIIKGESALGSLGTVAVNASAGSTGNPSKVEVRDSSGNVKWSIEVSGGAGGKGGTTSTAGGASGSNCSLKVFDGTSTTTYYNTTDAANAGIVGFACGIEGGAGNSVGGWDSTVNIGGSGGVLASLPYGQGGAGGVLSSPGGDSSPGRVELTYQGVYTTPAGGGGGGGAFYSSDQINVTPNSTLSIAVGGGGIGGFGGGTVGVAKTPANGTRGATSYVNFGSYSITTDGGYGGTHGQSSTLTFGSGGAGAAIASPGKSGSNGAGGNNDDVVTTFDSVGGMGGLGGIHSETAIVAPCGGMQKNSICATSPHGSTPEVYSTSFIETLGSEVNLSTAPVSAGGGGGGYDGVTSGDGGNGQGGFVYIWYRI